MKPNTAALRCCAFAALLCTAVAAQADGSLFEEIRRYYDAWDYLSTSSATERSRAALASGIHDSELQKIREAMELVDGLELPLRAPIPNPGLKSRWLLPIPRYIVSAPSFSIDGRSLVLECAAYLTDPSELYRLLDGPGDLMLVVESGGGGVPLGIELHRWMCTDSGWRKEPLKQILIGGVSWDRSASL